MGSPTVFISYSHRDEAWKDKLLPQLLALQQGGVVMQVWHDRKIDGGDQWYPEIEDAMANAAAAVLLISSDFLASTFCIQDEVPALLKRQETQGMLLIPVLLRPCAWRAHRWLKNRQMLPRDGKSVATDFAGDNSDTVFAAVAEQVFAHFDHDDTQPATKGVAAPIQRPPALPTTPFEAYVIQPEPVAPWPELPADHVDLIRLPETGSALFGRDDELTLLDEAWASREAGTPPVRIFALTAHGGVGKSTLVNQWLREMARDGYRGATRVFGWSFYSQGVRAETAASADTFIDAALRFFGDPEPTAGSPWDKGARLASFAGSQRSLLVLDGLEPLQSAHPFDRGELRDPALESLLRGLARQSEGLCLVTTREPLTGLGRRASVTMHDLEQINAQAGRALLRTARVVGTDKELEALATRFGPHALAVSLLGVYLREQPGHGIGPAQAIGELPGKEPIDRVLAAFEHWLGEGPERETLRLLGLFDRPADAGCLRALRTAPVIPGLTDRLVGLDGSSDGSGWDRVLARLEKLRLVHVQRGSAGEVSAVDAHPLIREHFAELMKGGEVWRAGHRRLYEYLSTTTKDKPDATLDDLQPLYQAVAHGCQAGMQQEACEVYVARIRRGGQNYGVRQLGAFGSELAAVACFFETPWSRVSAALANGAQAGMLSAAAFRLRALGRVVEALEPMRAGLDMAVQQEDWRSAAMRASNLSELELTLGEVVRAVKDAEQAVTYADTSGDAFSQKTRRARLADALHQLGDRAEAEPRFREAEEMQAKFQPDCPLLYTVSGFQYCDLLLAEAERRAWATMLGRKRGEEAQAENRAAAATSVASCRAVSQRAAQTLQFAKRSNVSILPIALDHLTLGRASLYASVIGSVSRRDEPSHSSPSTRLGVFAGDQRGLTSAATWLDAAVAGLRRAAVQHHLPRGLLTRAWCAFADASGFSEAPADKSFVAETIDNGPPHSVLSQRQVVDCETSAQSDLDEAWEKAERGPMPLFLADIHLYRARLFHAVTPYPWATDPDGRARGPHDDLAEARRLIEKHGYWRRKGELEDAEAAAVDWPRTTT